MICRESCSHIGLHRYEIPGLAPLQEPAEVEDDTEAQTQKPPKAWPRHVVTAGERPSCTAPGGSWHCSLHRWWKRGPRPASRDRRNDGVYDIFVWWLWRLYSKWRGGLAAEITDRYIDTTGRTQCGQMTLLYIDLIVICNLIWKSHEMQYENLWPHTIYCKLNRQDHIK